MSEWGVEVHNVGHWGPVAYGWSREGTLPCKRRVISAKIFDHLIPSDFRESILLCVISSLAQPPFRERGEGDADGASIQPRIACP